MIDYHYDIFNFIRSEENNYILPVPLDDTWEFSLRNFIQQCFLYKNGRLLTGNDDFKPVDNIILPIRNLQDWAEDIDVKDINIYANSKNKQGLSFIIKKYYQDIFIKENDLDTFIDEGKETKNDYGGMLVKNLNQVRPEVVPWQSIVFCDQTDILSGPIGIKHQYSPDQLKAMAEYGWGDTKNGATHTIDDLILLSTDYKQKDNTSQQAKTPGRYIEVYEVHGCFPENWLKDDGDEEKYVQQLHIVSYYSDDSGQQKGITLFKGKEKLEDVFDYFQTDKIFGRAIGRSRIEELFEPQVWNNYSLKRKMDMLDAASKTILKTTDSTLVAKHPSGLKDLDNLEIIELAENTDIGQLDTTPRSINLFVNAMNEFVEKARTTGGATDAMLGINPSSGTPFRLQNLVTNQGQGLHEGRKEKYARFIERIHRNWIIPRIKKELLKGSGEWLSNLDNDELEFVTERLSDNEANKQRNEMVLNGEIPADFETLKQQIKADWQKKGNVLPLEILKDELKGVELKLEINVAGVQQNMAEMVDKISNVLRQIIANPQGFMQAMQIPAFAKSFSKMIEFSGLSQPDFNFSNQAPQQIQAPQQQALPVVNA